MDPISVAAAAIAFAQMVSMIGVGLQRLRAIRHAPGDFMELLRELSSLHAFVDLVRRNVDAMHATQPECSPDAVVDLQALVASLDRVIAEINDLAVSLLEKRDSADKETGGVASIPKMKWIREKSRIVRLRDRSRQLRLEMSSWLTAASSLQGLHATQMMTELQDMVQGSCEYLAQGIRRSISTSEQSWVRLEMLEEAVNHDRKLAGKPPVGQLEYADHRIGSTSEPDGILNKPRKPREAQPVEGRKEDRQRVATSKSAEWLKSKKSETACHPSCRCQCHKDNYILTPKWLQPVAGSALIKYNGRLLNRTQCNLRTCLAAKPTSPAESKINFLFRPPSWIPMKAFNFSATITGVGARLFIKVPRFLNLDDVGRHLAKRDFIALRDKLAAGHLSPTDVEDTSGLTVLSWAMHFGYYDELIVLLALGFDPELTDRTGRTAFQWVQEHVIRRNALPHPNYKESLVPNDFVEKLCEVLDLDEGVEALQKVPGSTGTHEAVRGLHHISLEDCLMLNPHEIDAADSLGNTPLHYAVLLNDTAKAEVLIAHGADLDRANPYTGTRPLHSAVTLRRSAIVFALLAAGADADLTDGSGRTALQCRPLAKTEFFHALLARTADPDALNPWGDAGLHQLGAPNSAAPSLAVYRETLDAYLRAGADLERRNGYGDTPLLLCAEGRPAMVPYLLARGARADVVSEATGMTAVHNLLENARAEHVRPLRAAQFAGADPDRRDKQGRTALDILQARIVRKVDDEWEGGAGDRRRLTLADVLAFTRLVVRLREVNWAQGLHVASRALVLAEAGGDGSHDKMAGWVALVDRKLKRDKICEDSICESLNMWWQGYHEMPDHLTETDSSEAESDEEDDDVEFHDAEEGICEEIVSPEAEKSRGLEAGQRTTLVRAEAKPVTVEDATEDVNSPAAAEGDDDDDDDDDENKLVEKLTDSWGSYTFQASKEPRQAVEPWDIALAPDQSIHIQEPRKPVEPWDLAALSPTEKGVNVHAQGPRKPFASWDMAVSPEKNILKEKGAASRQPDISIVKVSRVESWSTQGSQDTLAPEGPFEHYGTVSYVGEQWDS